MYLDKMSSRKLIPSWTSGFTHSSTEVGGRSGCNRMTGWCRWGLSELQSMGQIWHTSKDSWLKYIGIWGSISCLLYPLRESLRKFIDFRHVAFIFHSERRAPVFPIYLQIAAFHSFLWLVWLLFSSSTYSYLPWETVISIILGVPGTVHNMALH